MTGRETKWGRCENLRHLPHRENYNIPGGPIFFTITPSYRTRKSRSNNLAALERSCLAGGDRGKRAYISFRAARGRAAWWRPICDASNSTPPVVSSTFSGLLPIYVCVRGRRCTCSRRGQNLNYLPCTIARLHIGRDAQHVITRVESKKTSASQPANRRSRANESEPTRPMAVLTYTLSLVPDVTLAATSRNRPRVWCPSIGDSSPTRSGLSANYRGALWRDFFGW